MPDGTVIIRAPRLVAIETTDDGRKVAKIELKRLGWCSLGLLAIGFVLGALVFL